MTIYIGTKHPSSAPAIVTGLDFPGNQNLGSGGTYTDFLIWNSVRSGTAVPQLTTNGMTVLLRCYLKASQLSYWSHVFHANYWDEEEWDGTVLYGGAHPFRDPPGMINPDAEKWEIAANLLDHFEDDQLCDYGVWFNTVYRVSASLQHRYHWNWGALTQGADVVTFDDTLTGKTLPSVPSLMIGGNSWAPRREVPNSILCQPRIWFRDLSDSEVDVGWDDPTDEEENLFYCNDNWTPTDVADESGNGNDPAWEDYDNPPALWEGP